MSSTASKLSIDSGINSLLVRKLMFHGREYDYAIQTLTKYMRNLRPEQRAALFGALEDEWCRWCGCEHRHCKGHAVKPGIQGGGE